MFGEAVVAVFAWTPERVLERQHPDAADIGPGADDHHKVPAAIAPHHARTERLPRRQFFVDLVKFGTFEARASREAPQTIE